MTADRHVGADDHGSLRFPPDDVRQQGTVWRLAGDGDPLTTRPHGPRRDPRAKAVAQAAGQSPTESRCNLKRTQAPCS